MKRISLLALGCTLGVAGQAGAQTGVLDQVSPFANGGQSASFNVDATFLVWQAQVRAGIDGQVEGAVFRTSSGVGGTATIRLRSGDVSNPGPVLASATILNSIGTGELVFADLSAGNLVVSAGDTYVLELQGDGNGLWLNGSYAPGGALYPEPLHLNGSQHADGFWRIGFETYMLDDDACAPDLSGSSDPNDPAYGVPDGNLDAADFFYYLDQFSAGNLPVADLSGSTDPNDPAYGVPDGTLDASDFFYYLDLFVAGCP